MSGVNLFFQCLLFINPNIGLCPDITTEHCLLFNSGSLLRSFNRICQHGMPTPEEIEHIKHIWQSVPFSWPVASNDVESITLLEKHGLTRYHLAFPAMQLDLATYQAQHYDKTHNVFLIENNDSLLEQWITIVASVFNYPEQELSKVISLFKRNITHALKLYLGYSDDKAVAACMAIHHGAVVTLHVVSVLPAYRQQGFGFAMIQQSLLDAQKNKCTNALLFASPAGLLLAKRIGFQECALYHMYGNYVV